ncbi:MAG: hypothetical protein IPO09_04160 [Anaeromyxobacter sp.]|nr:hypothetical protein [Anaeromyxobacter sp.]MBL0275779.1 hypothetical protein [Anaeromyxobacter sp.]
MPRSTAAPFLAVLLLAAGCAGEPCTAPSLTVAWRFDTPSGGQDASCAAVGVSTLNVFDGTGAPFGTGISCAQGSATFTNLQAGPYDLTVEGRDAAGRLVNRDWYRQEVGACGETRSVARPGQGDLRIAYDTSTGTCDAADLPGILGYMWFWLVDQATDQAIYGITSGSGNADKVLYPCKVGDLTLRVPYGVYRLDWIQEVRYPLATDPNPAYQYCEPTSATVHRAGITDLAVELVPVAGLACLP